MSRWLITGAAGMLGSELLGLLLKRGVAVTGLSRREADVTDLAAVCAAVSAHRPDVVVNCAAWTAVDNAETYEQQALAVNGTGPDNIAFACESTGARVVQVSTDYVFDGRAWRPYTEAHEPMPATAYGRTKLAGERAVLRRLPSSGYVVRTAWLYGAHGPNFVATMIRLEQQRPFVDVVADQLGQPTWAADVADRIVALAEADAPAGIYHATSSGETTWYGLAREVFRLLGQDPDRVRPTTTAAMARLAPRPAYSVLGHDGWSGVGLAPIGDWLSALQHAFPALLTAGGAVARSGDSQASEAMPGRVG